MNDELWMAHVNSVLQHDTLPEDEVITLSVYNSRLMNDDSLKPPAIIGGFTSLSRQSSLSIHDKTCNATHYAGTIVAESRSDWGFWC